MCAKNYPINLILWAEAINPVYSICVLSLWFLSIVQYSTYVKQTNRDANLQFNK